MSIRSVTLVALALPFSLLLAGCDRQSTAPTQAGETKEAASTIDRTFAGDPLPAAKLSDPEDATLDLATLKGKPVLLNLWATWCVPCVTEMPMIDDLAGEYGDRLQVVVASQDLQGADKVVPFFAKQKFANLHPWMDPENTLGFALGGGQLPTTVLYDAQGKEVWRVTGEFDWSGAEARGLVDEGLGSKP